jgi:DNA repair protein RAD57
VTLLTTTVSGVGKTQFLLILLLAAQLPPPQGLGRSALYISTEAALSTSRLGQLLHTHPILSRLSADERPTLDKVLSIQTPDLESQEHIIRYQVPVAIRRHDVGLIVIDSIAANYRAEFEPPNQPEAAVTTSQKLRQGASVTERRAATSMAERKPQLVQIGAYLRNLARTENIAIVVANQIADRFSPTQAYASSYPAPSATPSMTTDPLTLDHQQRWFTGWGDLPTYTPGHSNMKTPSLGLVWTNQISARIALIKENQPAGEKFKRRRWMRVVFATWASPSTGMGIEYDISAEGVRAVVIKKPASEIAEE